MVKSLESLLEYAKEHKTMKLAVAAAQDDDVLSAVIKAANEGIVNPILVGDIDQITEIASKNELSLDSYEMIGANSLEEAAEISVRLVKEGKADFVMKGLIDTSILLKAVLNKDYGLRTDSLLSHVMVYEVPTYHKLLFMTDGGMNIAPTLEQKIKILENAKTVAKAMGIETVKAAGLAAKEKPSDKMPATMDARAIQDYVVDGKMGNDIIFEGPLAFDLAISKEAAEIKKFKSEVTGDVDIMLMPTIEVGNGIGKALTYMANAKSAGIIMGAKVPIVLVSRADSYESKLYSIALGSVIALNQ